ncbi:MAG: glycosyltransferase [Lachnospiraceae bacterium]|nr:glycosyltransferase [Lachnospiraceae bacterium]
MTIDVVIPLYKPPGEFVTLIKMLRKQTLSINCIILVNSGREWYEQFVERVSFDASEYGAEVYHIDAKDFDHAGTRHMAMEKSDADVVIMMTQDAIPKDDTLVERLVAYLEKDSDIAVAFARQLPRKNAGVIEHVTREFNYPGEPSVKSASDIERLGIKAFFCSDVCAAYRRNLYAEVGGFKAPAIFNEDMVFAHDALVKGLKVAYAADAEVYHSHNYSLMTQLRRNFDLGVSQADHPEVFESVKSESEGKRLVKYALKRFNRLRRPLLIFPFGMQCVFKLLGYKLGKNYMKLPYKLVRKITGNKAYWKQNV